MKRVLARAAVTITLAAASLVAVPTMAQAAPTCIKGIDPQQLNQRRSGWVQCSGEPGRQFRAKLTCQTTMLFPNVVYTANGPWAQADGSFSTARCSSAYDTIEEDLNSVTYELR